MRSYEHDRDFVRVRDFLNETYGAFSFPCNWGLEQWNYARYFVAPFLGAYGKAGDTTADSLAAIEFWESMNRIWEDSEGNITGILCVEHPVRDEPEFGEICIQRHPNHLDLLEEMLSVGEELYANPELNRVYIWTFEEDEMMNRILKKRDYEQRSEPVIHHLEFAIGELPQVELPEGYRLLSMADECDIDKRREIFGRGFNHPDPIEWPSRLSYEELMRAPDYRREHDVFIVAPDGTYAACGILWYDSVSRVAHIEPLGTHPEHRKIGLARAIQYEALRLAKELGAERMPMIGGFEPFYRAVGFTELRTRKGWIKKL